jgi:hypothetical protein
MFALTHGLPGDVGKYLSDVVLVTVAASVVAHGVSVTPLMDLYARKNGRRGEAKSWPSPQPVS